jgi:hypothetical protein
VKYALGKPVGNRWLADLLYLRWVLLQMLVGSLVPASFRATQSAEIGGVRYADGGASAAARGATSEPADGSGGARFAGIRARATEPREPSQAGGRAQNTKGLTASR